MKKRILIIGEFSSVGKAFVEGFLLQKNKFIVDHISDGDGYKGIGNSFLTKHALFRYIFLIFQALRFSLKRYEYGIWLSPFVFKKPLFVIKLLNSLLFNACRQKIVYNCTTDSVYWRHYNLKLNRKTLLGFLHDTDFKIHRFSKSKYYKYNLFFVKKMDFIFCASEEYYFPYSEICETKILRYPLLISNLENIFYSKSIKHYHGITREGFKGTKYILNELKSNNITPHITSQISFNKFVENLKKTIVYYDQFHTIFPGIAALLSLHYCPYVFSGIDKNLLLDKKYAEECPIIDFQNEFKIVEVDLDNHEFFKSKLTKNRDFIQKNHSPKFIVSKMLKFINEIN